MTTRDLENEVVMQKVQLLKGITLKILIHECGKPRPNGFPQFFLQAQISKTLTPGDF